MKSIRITFAVLLSLLTHFTISQEFRKSTITAYPKKRKLINMIPQQIDCVEGPGKGVITGKSGTKFSSSGKEGKSGSKGVSSGKSGAKKTSSGKSGNASKKDIISSSSGKGGNVFAITGKGGSTNAKCNTPSPPPSISPIPLNPELEFDLEVINGSGDGTYIKGTEVTITAEEKENKIFREWKVNKGPSGFIANDGLERTTLTMPNRNVTVEAFYSDANTPLTEFNLNVINGNGTGFYEEGSVNIITAIDRSPMLGGKFTGWKIVDRLSGIITNLDSETTTLTMPEEDVTVEAEFSYDLNVTDGSGDGSYSAGKRVVVTAIPPTPGSIFIKWNIVSGPPGIVVNENATTSILNMPAQNVKVEALFEIKYELIVTNGSGDGRYTFGTEVKIDADPASSGQSMSSFTEWVIINGPEGIIGNKLSGSTNVNMPAGDVTVRAIYFR